MTASPFVIRLEAEDGTTLDVPLDFDFSDFTAEEQAWVAAQPLTDLTPACLYVKVAREAPDLPFEMFKDAFRAVIQAGEMEVIGGGP